MSKFLFAAVLRKNGEVSNCQVDYFWQLAKKAKLSEKIFNQIQPHMHLFPELQAIYAHHGKIEKILSKHDVKQKITECLENGACYTKYIVLCVPADAELILTCINELLVAERITYHFCVDRNERLYSLVSDYREIQKAIIKTLKTNGNSADMQSIFDGVTGVKKEAISQNLSDLFMSGKINLKHGRYTCISK